LEILAGDAAVLLFMIAAHGDPGCGWIGRTSAAVRSTA